MKKFFCLILIILTVGEANSMYHQGRQLKYTEVELTNQSLIPLKLKWVEIDRGHPEDIIKEIYPDETITVNLGKQGNYFQNMPAKIIYNPIPGNDKFKQEFTIDLPNSPKFVFTATKLSEILNNVWVPGVFSADEKGDLSTFRYMNVDPIRVDQAMIEAGSVKKIQY